MVWGFDSINPIPKEITVENFYKYMTRARDRSRTALGRARYKHKRPAYRGQRVYRMRPRRWDRKKTTYRRKRKYKRKYKRKKKWSGFTHRPSVNRKTYGQKHYYGKTGYYGYGH